MPTKPHLSDILDRWEAERKKGHHLTPEELCASCPELLHEARKHIAALQFMEPRLGMQPAQPARPTPAAMSGSQLAATVSRHTGATAAVASANPPVIPGYEILGELGRGGMGVVYKARHVALNRLVALKMMKANSHDTPQELVRFQTEAAAVARLQHPNIVQIFETGQYDGRPYVTLEFVDGSSLDKKLKAMNGTTLPVRAAAEIIETLARAVHHAHVQRIVHRDLKPANVLQTKSGILKITDFGLAKNLDVKQGQTADGAVLGTPCYMAPEQALGKMERIGPTTDVYALGVMLYEFLTGRLPFQGESAMDVLLQVAGEEPVPPRRLHPKVPPDLDTICLKCLEKSNEKRYASAEAFADELRRFLQGEPIHARPLSTWGRGVKWAKRKPAQAGVVLLLVLLAIGFVTAFAIVSWQLGQTAKALRNEEHAKIAEGEARAAEKTRREEAEAAERKATDRADELENHFYDDRVSMAQREWEDNNLAKVESLLAECPGRWKSWEWRYFQRQLPDQAAVLRGHKEVIACIVFSPDGRRVASADASGKIKIWDAATYQECAAVTEKGVSSCALAFSPDGKFLAVPGGSASTVTVLDATTGKQISTFSSPPGERIRPFIITTAVAYTRDGTIIAAGNRDGSLMIWDANTGNVRHDIRKRKGGVSSIAFTPDGALLAVASGSDVVIVDPREGEVLRSMQHGKAGVAEIAVSPDGKRVASASADGVIKVWDISGGQELLRMAIPRPTHIDAVYRGGAYSIAYSPDGKYLATAHADSTVRIWDAETGQEAEVVRKHNYAATAVAYSFDGKRLATGGADLLIRISEVADLPAARTISGLTTAIRRVSFSPDGKTLACGCDDGSVRTWSAVTWQEAHIMHKHTKAVEALAFSPDSRYLATGADDSCVMIWDVRSGAEAGSFFGTAEGIRAVAFSPDGKTVASGGWRDYPSESKETNQCRLWDVNTGRQVSSLPTKDKEMFHSIAYSPDGKRLAGALTPRGYALGYGALWQDPDLKKLTSLGPYSATRASLPGILVVWELESKKPVSSVNAHPAQIHCLAFSKDGKILATASRDGTMKLWDALTGKEARTLHGHGGAVTSVAFNQDGTRVVSGSEDKTVRLWDAKTGKQLLVLRGHTDAVSSVAFSPDGHRIASASKDKTVKVWDGSPLAKDAARKGPGSN